MTAIRVDLELADGSFTTRMMRAGQTIRQFKNEVAASTPALGRMTDRSNDLIRSVNLASHAGRGFLGTLRDISVVAGVTSMALSRILNIQDSWIGAIVKVNSEFERLNYQMRSLSTSSNPIKEAGQNVQYLLDRALKMPFQLKTINDAFVKLKATGTDPLKGSLQALADGVAAFGGTDEALHRIVLGVSQMSGKGVIQMEELRQQLGEQMPTAVRIMADAMGVSMARLLKDISTGTMRAKESLDLFFAQINRVYGGRAQYLMQTFSGQVNQLGTRLQILAKTIGGLNDQGNYIEGGFMDTLRDQLQALNDFIGSRAGNVLAEELGRGLSTAVMWIRRAIDLMIEFRSEIVNVGKIIGSVFAFKAVMSGLGAMDGMLTGWVQKVKVARLAWIALGNAMREASLINASWARGAAIRAGVGAFTATIGAAVPLVGALGLAVYGAAEYFGVFRDRTREAWQELVKFGAESRKQVEDAGKALVEAAETELKRLQQIAKMRRDAFDPNQPGSNWNKSFIDEADRAVAEQQKKVEALRAQYGKVYQEAAAREDERASREYMKRFDEGLRERQNTLTADLLETEKKYNERVKKAREAGESIANLEKKLGEEKLALNERFETDRINVLEKSIDEQKKIILSSVDSVQIAQATKILGVLNERLLQHWQERLRIQKQIAGTPIGGTGVDDAKLMAKGQKRLEQLQAEVKGLAASFSGANAEVVELQELLNSGKYGNIDTEGVQKLIDKLVEAKAQKELLDEVMEGKNRLESDIRSASIRAEEERIELEEKRLGRKLEESEKVRIRIQSGYYKGFGPESETVKWLMNLLRNYDLQGAALDKLGKLFRNNTFGSQTVARIRTTADELKRIADYLASITNLTGGINFSNFNLAGNRFLPGGALRMASPGVQAKAGDLMSMLLKEGASLGVNKKVAAAILGNFMKESGLDTGIVGDKGTSFGLAQWHNERWDELKQFAGGMGMDQSNPLAQIRFTLHEMQTKFPGLISRMNMAASVEDAATMFMREFEKPKLATANLPGRQSAARDVYELPSISVTPANSEPMETYEQGEFINAFLEERNRLIAEYDAELDKIAKKEKANRATEFELKRRDALRDLKAEAKEATTNVDNLNKHYAALVKKIEAGDLGESKDINAKEYEKLIAAAKELDRVEHETNEKKKAKRQLDREEERFAEKRLELARQAEEAHARMLDPLEKKSSRAYRKLERDLDDYVQHVKTFYEGDKQKYQEALDYKEALLKGQKATETAEYFADLARKTQLTRRSLLTETQQRRLAMQEELELVDRRVEMARQAGMNEVEITRQAEEAKAAIRAKYQAQMNPLGQQMQEWSDLQGNLAKASTQWMSSLADGLTNLIMGTGDLRSVIQGILKDLINIGIKYLMSQVMGAKGQVGANTGGKGKLAAGAKSASTGGKGKLFGALHTGGIVGMRPRMTRVVDPRVFAGAPRFHAGGIVGSDEVPIIARKGEGVFTPEQMQAMGGFQQNIQINAPVTVQGSAGTPAQNEDLAKRTAKHMEGTIRGIVVDEFRRQSRPGNMANPGKDGR